MIHLKRYISIILTLCMMAGIFTITSEASARRKIASVSLTITSGILPDSSIDPGDVTVECKGNKYSVEELEFLNQEPFWKEDSVPELKVTLIADEDYYFSVNEQNIKLEGASFVSLSKENLSQTLHITVKLDPLNEKAGTVAAASWSGTKAIWEPAYGAGSYEIRLIKDGKLGITVTAAATCYDFISSLSKPGTYSFRVRSVNAVKAENKGDWTEAGSIYVDAEQAAKNRKAASASDEGWVLDNTGWWYRNTDGTYDKSTWRMINGQWYYFREDGYMATGWVQDQSKWYYCREDGSMMSGEVTPDGYRLGEDGTWAE